MQNISRRVFIKGMAVAAVATAASTVLAGCNFVPGTEEKGEETGFAPITKTVEYDKDNAVNVTVTGYSFNEAAGVLGVSVKVTNATADKTVAVKDTAGAADDLVFDAYIDTVTALEDNKLDPQTTVGNDKLWSKSIASKKNDVAGGVGEGVLYFTVDDDKKDWKTLTLKATLVTAYSSSVTGSDVAEFVINR